jgi:hypothetical protein
MAASKRTSERELTPAVGVSTANPNSVPASTDLTAEEHPLAGTLGAFADDPAWDLMLEEIRRLRAEADASE